MARVRVDLLLVRRGLAETRAKAQAAIAAGGVAVDGRVVTRASETVDENADMTFAPPHPWVSRGGVKLAAALDSFGIDPAGRVCLDVGASTGGFTQVLLARGAARVYAVDVGHGQIHADVAGDARAVVLEGLDARQLTRERMPEAPSLVVCDASFIGLEKVIAAPLALAAHPADLVALIKPQFEAGPGAGRNGVLDEETARTAAGAAIARLDGLEGLSVQAFCDSPIRGGEGNLEILVWAQRV